MGNLAVDLRLDNHEVTGDGGSLRGSARCGAGTSDDLDGGTQEGEGQAAP